MLLGLSNMVEIINIKYKESYNAFYSLNKQPYMLCVKIPEIHFG